MNLDGGSVEQYMIDCVDTIIEVVEVREGEGGTRPTGPLYKS